MIVCPTCGHQNGDQESFCASCGAYIAAAGGDAPASGQGDAPEVPAAADTPASTPPEPVVPKKPAAKPVVPRPKSPPADAERAGRSAAAETPTDPVALEPAPVVPGPVVPPAPDAPTERIVRRLPPTPTGRARQPPSGAPMRQPGPEPAATAGAGATSGHVAMAANEIACPSCAAANDADRTFCRQCGSLLRPVVDPVPVTAGPPRSRLPVDGRVLAAGIVVLGLAGIALAALLLRPGPEPGASASPSVIAVASPTPIALPSQQPSDLPSTPPPSEPPPSPVVVPSEPSGLLVYASRPSGGTRDIWRVEIGTDPIKLTSAAGDDWDPDLSFDGSRIAWASPRGIRVSDIDGDDHFLLTHHDELDLSPAWSPDGEFIAFSSRRDGRWEIYLREAVEGASDLEPLTKNTVADHEPSWSPDGDALVYTRGSAEKAELYIVDVETKDTTRLTKNDVEDEDPAWSPDGTTIAFSRTVEGESDLYLLTVEGRQLTRLTDTDGKHEHDPAWSPDGAYLAFQARGVVQIMAVATHEVVATLDLPGAAAFVSWR